MNAKPLCDVRTIFVTAVLAFAAAPSAAQYMNPYSGVRFNNMYQANIDRILSESIQRKMLESSIKRRLQRQGNVPAAPPPANYRHPVSATDFVPAGKRRVPEQIGAGGANASERQQLTAACRQIHETIENTPGFRKNNFANALALLLGVSLQVLTGREIDEAETDALIRDLNEQIAAGDGFKRLTAEQRTVAYDTFVIMGGLIAGIAQTAAESNDAQMAQQARDLARDALAGLGGVNL